MRITKKENSKSLYDGYDDQYLPTHTDVDNRCSTVVTVQYKAVTNVDAGADVFHPRRGRIKTCVAPRHKIILINIKFNMHLQSKIFIYGTVIKY